MKLSSLSLRSRLYLGFAALVTLGVAMAGIGIFGLSSVTASVGNMEAISANLVRVQEVNNQLEIIRRAANRFSKDADPASLDDMKQAETRAAALWVEAAAASFSEQRRATFNRLGETLRATIAVREAFVRDYQTGFAERAQVFTGGEALTTVAERVVGAVRAGTNDAVRPAAGHLEAAMLSLRVASLRFLATLDPKGPAIFKTNQANAEAALAELEQAAADNLKPLIPPARAALAAYAEHFEVASASLVKGAEALDNQLRPQIIAMQKETASGRDAAQQNFNQNTAESKAEAAWIIRLQLIAAIAGAIIGTVLAVVIGRSIVRPITSMTAAMTRLASGDSTVEIPGREDTTEIGEMARAVNVFKENGIEAARVLVVQQAETEAKVERAARLDALTMAFEQKAGELVGQVSTAADELQTTAQSMTNTAGQTTQQATNVAAAAEEASVNVQTVAAASEELASSITEISRQVAQSAHVASKARDDAQRTDAVVQALAAGAQKIGEVVGLISSIAAQTNLLALNATIEAARAGDAGKGFAVVASEVKNLATQTAKATEDIGRQITEIQNATTEAVASIGGIGVTITEISEIAASIAAAVEEQGAATQEIARNVQQAASGTQEVSSNIVGVSQGANDAGAAATQVLGAAGTLSRQAAELRSEVDQYIAGIKAA